MPGTTAFELRSDPVIFSAPRDPARVAASWRPATRATPDPANPVGPQHFLGHGARRPPQRDQDRVYDTARTLSASYPRESLNGDRPANSVPGWGLWACLRPAVLVSRRWFLS